MTQQITFRTTDEMAARMDILVSDGWYPTRTELLTDAVAALLAKVERDRVDTAIRQGYEMIPPTELEEDWAAASTRDLAIAERW